MTSYKTTRVYMVTLLPTLDVMVPNIREYQYTLDEALNVFTNLTGEDLAYDVCYPIEYLICDLLHTTRGNAGISLRELELDYDYIYSELNTLTFQDAAEVFSDCEHKAEYIHDSNVAEILSDIAQIMAGIVLDLFKYISKGDYLMSVDISCINEVVVHDTADYCAVQYLTYVTRKEGEDDGIRQVPS